MVLPLDVTDLAVGPPGRAPLRVPRLQLACGEAAALLGPSGCGKSTVLAAMFGLLDRTGWSVGGSVAVAGEGLASLAPAAHRRVLRERMVYLPQDAAAALDPLQPVGRQIADATGASLADCAAMLTRLGVADAPALAARAPFAISGGQAQRVLLAVAFLRAPALVVADEPTASLDGGTHGELLLHLRALLAQGSALLTATHDHRLVHELPARALTLRDGAFVHGEVRDSIWPAGRTEPSGGDVVLGAQDVHVAHGERRVLAGVDFECRRGELVAIVGESGAGKTTLLRVLAGDLAPAAGRVVRPARRTAVQLLFQDAAASLTPGVPIGELLAEAHAPGFDPQAGAAAVALPFAALAQPRERLSGGEQRRAALLRALAVEPDVLLLDEPTASLDAAAALAIVQTLLRLQRTRGLAIVLVTHDHALARAVARHVLELRGGRLCPS
jgi:peptide/nickel transport system ATP-binding protein